MMTSPGAGIGSGAQLMESSACGATIHAAVLVGMLAA